MRKPSNERFQSFLKASTKYYTWDIILAEANIKDVSDKGDQYEIPCPLHEDWSPSMRLTKHNGVYHCFSCGAAGTYTKFLWELSGRGIPYAEFCEQILKANPAMQLELKFKSLFVDEKSLAPEFNQRRVFKKDAHLGQAMPITTLASKVRSLGDTWENLVVSLSLLQTGMTTDGVYEVIRKRHEESAKIKTTKKMSVMDLIG